MIYPCRKKSFESQKKRCEKQKIGEIRMQLIEILKSAKISQKKLLT
jgi:hypothetical protein